MRYHPRTTIPLFACALLTLLTATRPAHAWHAEGHMLVASLAVGQTPEDMPAFFREAAPVVAHLAVDPDVFKARDTPQLRASEGPEHYLDLEYLGDRALPANRYGFYALCQELELNPTHVGLLPYAIREWQQRLTLAFAEHRRQPDSQAIRMKCLVYAGILSHYTADLHMPLHTTIHFDGRADENMRSSRNGIHEHVDGLLKPLTAEVVLIQPLGAIEAAADPWQHILSNLTASHALVDQVYEFEPILLHEDMDPMANEAVQNFAIDRARAGVRFTAEVFATAWGQSEEVDLGPIDREGLDAHYQAHVQPED